MKPTACKTHVAENINLLYNRITWELEKFNYFYTLLSRSNPQSIQL